MAPARPSPTDAREREPPRVVSSVVGRVRVNLPDWHGEGRRHIERTLRALSGIQQVAANRWTRNVLVRFDPAEIDEPTVVDEVTAVYRGGELPVEVEREPPPVVKIRRARRAHVAVHGLDRDPEISDRILRHLSQRKGIRTVIDPLTSHVLLDFDEGYTDFENLLADIGDIELPPLPGELHPSHPLDPLPMVQSASRTTGAALGLGLLAARRLFRSTGELPAARLAAGATQVIGLLRAFPTVRRAMRRWLGRDMADMVFSLLAMATLTLSNNPLGLTLTGTEGLLLLIEAIRRRGAWNRYEQSLGSPAHVHKGDVIRLQAGDRLPRRGTIVEGVGTVTDRHALPVPIAPGDVVAAGGNLSGGPFVVEILESRAFQPAERPAPPRASFYRRYIASIQLASLAFAAAVGLGTLSLRRAYQALLFVNPRIAVIGMEAANINTITRVVRAGGVIVGTRQERIIRTPDVMLFDSPRMLTDGLELTGVMPADDKANFSEIAVLASRVASAAGAPWQRCLPRSGNGATDASFDGRCAAASHGGIRYSLSPLDDGGGKSKKGATPLPPGAKHWSHVLRRESDGKVLGTITFRPRLAQGVDELARACKSRGVTLGVLPGSDRAWAHDIAHRAGATVMNADDALSVIHEHQQRGHIVSFVSDGDHGAHAFAACDLAVGVIADQNHRFQARADVLAPDLGVLAALVDSGARRDAATRDAVLLSIAHNVFGAWHTLRPRLGDRAASQTMYYAALLALGDSWFRLQGGERSRSRSMRLVDPDVERWGAIGVEEVLNALATRQAGLTGEEALRRRRWEIPSRRRLELFSAVRSQVRSPATLILGGAALLSLLIGQSLDAAMIAGTVAINVAAGVWQERRVGQAAEALERVGAMTARVLRDGHPVSLPATEVVRGDILLLQAGDRVPADARLLSAQGFEVDEAALTGESLPVAKSPDAKNAADRIVLDGADVVVGTARAVAAAVGRQTRLGATAAVMALDETEESPLGKRLAEMLRLALPVSVGGGALATLSGMLWGRPLMSQLTLGVSTAVAVVPEGLLLLAGLAEMAVARRLAGHQALVRRLAAVEALGRVDVACTDKTGTITLGRLRLSIVADASGAARKADSLTPELRDVLLTAALACPRPNTDGARAHPTDVAVVEGARQAGWDEELLRHRRAESPFDAERSFHASIVGETIHVKGAPEVLVERCAQVWRDGRDEPLADRGRQALLDAAQRLAAEGHRVLLVARGPAQSAVNDPGELVALGFVGIADPVRPGVEAAVRRCRDAGIRVIMLTGDHPATARAIARDAGLVDGTDDLLTGAELAELDDEELRRRIGHASVIARATPLHKLRIIDVLRDRGHVVAMTGDGVNDAPALGLADVGIAMGRAGTEVARQAADVVLADDDFATLVESLIEGRGFWQNMRSAMGLLLGGNLGELGLIVGASLMGQGSPLNTRQILAINLITDALPAFAVAVQHPKHRNLAGLAREGPHSLDIAVRKEIFRRALSTAVPSLAAYIAGRYLLRPEQSSTVAFGSIISTQLAQTLDAGRRLGGLSSSVYWSVLASFGALGTVLAYQPCRTALGLALPTPGSLFYIGAASIASAFTSRLLIRE